MIDDAISRLLLISRSFAVRPHGEMQAHLGLGW